MLKRIKEQMAGSYRASWGKTLGTDAKSFPRPDAEGLSQTMMTTYVSALIHAFVMHPGRSIDLSREGCIIPG